MPEFLNASKECLVALEVNNSVAFYEKLHRAEKKVSDLVSVYYTPRYNFQIPEREKKKHLHELEICSMCYVFKNRWGRYPCFDEEKEKNDLKNGLYLTNNQWIFLPKVHVVMEPVTFDNVFFYPVAINMTSSLGNIWAELRDNFKKAKGTFITLSKLRDDFFKRFHKRNEVIILKELEYLATTYDEHIKLKGAGAKKLDPFLQADWKKKDTPATLIQTRRRLQFCKRLVEALRKIFLGDFRKIPKDPYFHVLSNLELFHKAR